MSSLSIYDEIERIKQEIEKDDQEPLRIALFGQPGSGKSSIINKLVGEKVAETGASTDVTTTANIFNFNGLLLVDLPGYGTSKFPPNDWFDHFKPEDYDLFLCVFSGKFHEADTTFFRELKEEKRTVLFVRNMADQIWEEDRTEKELHQVIIEDVHKQIGSNVTVYFTSCRKNTGFEELQDAIQDALEPAKRDKYARYAKAYSEKHLEQKREECKKLVTKYSGLAAANGINPIPGLDISVDFTMMLKLFSEIRKIYGLNDEKIKNLGEALMPIAKKVIDYATKEGLALLLKRFATKTAVKSTVKYVPIVGQVIAASTSFAITYSAGSYYLEDCHKLAVEILKKELH